MTTAGIRATVPVVMPVAFTVTLRDLLYVFALVVLALLAVYLVKRI